MALPVMAGFLSAVVGISGVLIHQIYSFAASAALSFGARKSFSSAVQII
jgi:hypothetical protein